ncbi:MAG: HAMP domain-containing histidine kinase [Clostridia bacterium]|nr:HAMP domain-containing histidine kinase [Clostridia bacterium]
MFKSIFSKYITVFMIILVVCCTTLAAVSFAVFNQYTVDIKRDVIGMCSALAVDYLENECRIIDEYSFEYAMNRKYTMIREYFSTISPIENELFFTICDTDGLIYITDVPYGQIFNNMSETDIAIINNLDGLTEVELDEVFAKKHLSYASPIIGKNDVCIGALIVSTESGSMTGMVNTFFTIIALTFLWRMTLAFDVVYFLSDRISAPLRSMRRAAKSFSQGKFDVRIPVHGRDEIAELAVAFNNMAEKLDNSEAQRKGFLANVSHDLRTPMTTISGFVDAILCGAIPPEKYDHYLSLIGNEVKRLSRLVNLLLDMSRIEAGDRKFNFITFDICETARQILISNEQRLEAKKLDVEFECDDDNMFVIADKDTIYRILYNICDNAIKFSDEGGKYRISITSHDKKTYVSVYNEGKGIPQEDLPYVFDRFYKSDKSRGLDKSGVGLGLHIVKTIIDAHEENIWVKSEYGKYCEFVFTLKPTAAPKAARHSRLGAADENERNTENEDK